MAPRRGGGKGQGSGQRETFSNGESEANKSMRPQKKRRGDQSPRDLQGLVEAGMQRLQGVYNKLQVWKLFDDERNPHQKSKRVCMLDCGMMIRQHDGCFFQGK